MTLKELHEQYGQVMIQLEILQSRANELKRLIAEEMNKSNQKVVVKENESNKPI